MLGRGVSKSVVLLTGDLGFESISLQRRVSCEPEDGHRPFALSSQYRYPSSKKDAGVDDRRHRQGCGWQTRDRETLPSRTERKGANKATELSDFSVCTTWGVRGKDLFLLNVLRKRLEYPALKRAVREQHSQFDADVVLIEDKASGTQLIQELIADGFHRVKRYKPECDKIMRLHAQTATIENGFVHLPEAAPWLAEYLHEMTVFPKGKHDDQVDSTAQFLDWFKKPFPSWGIYEHTRRMAEKLKHSEPLEQFHVRLKAPAGIGSVQTFSGRHLNVSE